MGSRGRGRVRFLVNRIGFWRASLNPWVLKLRNNPERLAFVLHRVTGFILLAYLLAHIIVTNTPARTGSWSSWEHLMSLFNNPFNRFGEFIVMGALIFHGLNGIRLLLTEFFNIGIGEPEIPKPPYIPPTARSLQRRILYIVFVLSIILWVVSGLIIFGLWR